MVYKDQLLAYVTYVHTPNFGHVYADTYANFSSQILYDFKLFKNLLL